MNRRAVALCATGLATPCRRTGCGWAPTRLRLTGRYTRRWGAGGVIHCLMATRVSAAAARVRPHAVCSVSTPLPPLAYLPRAIAPLPHRAAPPPSRSPTPRADTDSDAITHRSTLARAFRQRCQQLGAPLTCPFMACSGACQNPECDDCKNQSTYDPRKHGQIVAELKRRASGSFAFRWRDTG